MPNFNSTQLANLKTTPPVRVKVNQLHGRLRYAIGTFTNPASSGALIADTISFVRLGVGSRIAGYLSQLNWSTGAASCTLNVGDAVTAARHLAATAVTTAGVAVPQAAQASGATFETSDGSLDGTGEPSATNNCDVRSTVAGANVAASQVIALHMAYVQD